MGHINLEHSVIWQPRLYNARHGQIVYGMTGSFVIAPDAPSMIFLDPNGADRDVFMPPVTPDAGQLYFIANIGNAFDLNVRSGGGTLLAPVKPLTVGVFASCRSIGWVTLTQPSVITPTQLVQRRTTASPIVITGTDDIINCDISAVNPTCTLPDSVARAGKPIVFKDVNGNFGAHPLTITAGAGQPIDGMTSIQLVNNYSYLRLRPLNDGTNVGWTIEQ